MTDPKEIGIYNSAITNTRDPNMSEEQEMEALLVSVRGAMHGRMHNGDFVPFDLMDQLDFSGFDVYPPTTSSNGYAGNEIYYQPSPAEVGNRKQRRANRAQLRKKR